MEANFARSALRATQLGRLSSHNKSLLHATLSSCFSLPLSFPPFFFLSPILSNSRDKMVHRSTSQRAYSLEGEPDQRAGMGSAGWENFKRASNRGLGSELRHSDCKEQRCSLEFPQQMEHICKATIAGLTGRNPVRCSRFNSHWIWENSGSRHWLLFPAELECCLAPLLSDECGSVVSHMEASLWVCFCYNSFLSFSQHLHASQFLLTLNF